MLRVRGTIVSMNRRAWAAVMAFLSVALIAAALTPVARADGDPGSDVLVYQDLFAGSDAGLSVQQQVQLGDLLKAAAREGFPVRVAIIASPFDLGSVTELWRQPREYARFLGIELSLAYKQRLLVVMPNGFGFNWPGHSAAPGYRALGGIPIGAGGAGLFNATEAAVGKLALAGGVKLPSIAHSAGAPAAPGGAAGNATGHPAQKSGVDDVLGIVALALVAIAGVAFGVRTLVRRRGWSRPPCDGALRLPAGRLRLATAATVLLVVLAVTLVILARSNSTSTSQADALATNPDLDPGTPVSGVAPDFSLSDQFGQPVSLHSFHGKVVILAFNDSECTTVCPLTTTAMLDAKAMLGKAGSQVQLLGVDADPAAISLEDVWSYSELHGMLHSWRFLTGSLPQLKQVWKQYGIEAAVQAGEITHTPALFVIGPGGRLSRLYMTQMSYTAVPSSDSCWPRARRRCCPPVPRCVQTCRTPRYSRPRLASTRRCLGRGEGPSRSAPASPRGYSCSSPPGIRRPVASPASLTRSTGIRRSRDGPACPSSRRSTRRASSRPRER